MPDPHAGSRRRLHGSPSTPSWFKAYCKPVRIEVMSRRSGRRPVPKSKIGLLRNDLATPIRYGAWIKASSLTAPSRISQALSFWAV